VAVARRLGHDRQSAVRLRGFVMWIPPLLIVPLIIYNLVAFDVVGAQGAGWAVPVFSVSMVSGAIWGLSVGDLLILLSLALLFVEVIKATNTGNQTVFDHLFSTVVFVVYLVEFLLVPKASTSLFFICLAMSFVDVVAGFSVSIRAASRDVNFR
jgi:hypothetical protein